MSQSARVDPRWGSANRPAKAGVIWQTLLHFCGPGIAERDWVDVGCGSGGIAAALAPRVKRILGVDPEPWTRWTDWMGEHHNLRFVQARCDDMNPTLAPCSADVVICNQVYEHVADPQALIRFIHLILKPGGWCYFAGPNLLFPIEPHVFWPFIHWLPRAPAQRLMRALGARHVVDADSVSYWTLLKWFRGFTVINAVPYILRHPEELGRTGKLWRLIACLPAPWSAGDADPPLSWLRFHLAQACCQTTSKTDPLTTRRIDPLGIDQEIT